MKGEFGRERKGWNRLFKGGKKSHLPEEKTFLERDAVERSHYKGHSTSRKKEVSKEEQC